MALETLQPLPFPEAFNNDEVRLRFEEMVAGHIPGFIMRAANVELGDAPQAFAEHAAAVHGKEYTVGPTITKAKDIIDGGDAGLHADASPDPLKDEQYHIWEGVEGEAEISIAAPGPLLAQSGISERYDKRLNDLFRAGQTDTDLMAAGMSTSIAGPGDKVIFPTVGPKPTFHNVDTISTRISNITTVGPERTKRQVAPAPDTHAL